MWLYVFPAVEIQRNQGPLNSLTGTLPEYANSNFSDRHCQKKKKKKKEEE